MKIFNRLIRIFLIIYIVVTSLLFGAYINTLISVEFWLSLNEKYKEGFALIQLLALFGVFAIVIEIIGYIGKIFKKTVFMITSGKSED